MRKAWTWVVAVVQAAAANIISVGPTQLSGNFAENYRSPTPTLTNRIAILSLLGAIWLIILTVGFYLAADRLLLSNDGRYFLTMVGGRIGLDWPWTSDSIDFLHGIGDQFYPFRPNIIPVYRILVAVGLSDAGKIASFVWLALEVTVSVTFLARSMGASFSTGFGAGTTAVVCTLPLWKFGAVYTFVHIAPQFSTLVAASTLAVGFYLRVGRRGSIVDFAYALIIAGLLIWFILASPLSFMLPAPLLGTAAIVGLFAAADNRERWCKAAVLAGLTILVFCGPAEYLVSEVMSSAAFVFNIELQNSLSTWGFASIIFHARDIGLAGPVVVASAVAGVFTHWRSPNRTLRFFGYGILTYLATRLTFAWLTITFDFWRGPAPIYFELFVLPIYCVYAWLFWEQLTIWAARRWLHWCELPYWYTACASLAILGCAVITGNRHRIIDPYLYPPQATAITKYLAENSRLIPGQPFRGRVATMNGLNLGNSVSWFDLVAKTDPVSLRYTGNDHRQSGLRYFGTPVLFEYSPMATAPFYAVTTRLLGYPQDSQVRNIQVLRRVDPRILAMLGVRYVITDAPVADKRTELRVTLPLGDEGKLYLYEVAHPNLGDYSPVRAITENNATEIINKLADSHFDPATAIILQEEVKTGLVAATNAKMIFEGARMHVTANSAGRSLLMIPLEYSHCLKVTSQTSVRLLRANLVETAIEFENNLDARIELRTGPFLHPLCRFDDIADDRKLLVRHIPRHLGGR